MSAGADDPAFDATLPALLATGAPVAATRRRVLEGLFGGDGPATQVGRFELRTPLGRGSFGTVWRAFDPRLEREVAVKIIDGGAGFGSAEDRTRRFLREARTIASLSSDHVVRVFDYGVLDGSPYLAMELMRGGSLERWLLEPRPWQAVLAVFSEAAQGLAAAHEAGIVHRDFKPANVLLDEQGHARVADFGLAVLGASALDSSALTITAGSSSTDTGTLSIPHAGTPAFMAPEQHFGGELDERADIYAFCASLHAGLHGCLPFEATTLAELMSAKAHRRITRESRGGAGAPRWLRAVVERGLAPQPEDRWPSMTAVLAALEQGPRRARRRWILVAASAGVVATALLIPTAHAPDCEATARASLDEIWSPSLRSTLEPQLAARAGLAEDVLGRLDEHAKRWVRARTATCSDGRDGAVAARLLDARGACLQRAATSFAATIERLRDADPTVLDHARELVRGLDDPEACAAALPQAGPAWPTDADAVAEIEAIRDELAALHVARRAGLLAAELPAARALAERARGSDYVPVQAEATLMHGRAEQAAGHFDVAAVQCEQAYWDAVRSDQPALALESALCVARVRGLHLDGADVALDWARQAEAALVRAGRPELEAARLEDTIAGIYWAKGDAATALVHHDRAIDRYEHARVPSPRLHAVALSNRANALADLGRTRDASASLRTAATTLERELGRDHELTAVTHCSLGSLLSDEADPAAVTELEACIAVLRARVPADHVWLVQAQANLGLAHRVLGEPTRARQAMEQALAAAQTVPGLTGVDLRVGIGSNLGDLLRTAGEDRLAHERFAIAHAIARDELGGEDPRTLLLEIRLGQIEAQDPESAALARTRLDEVIAVALAHDQPDSAAMARFELAQLRVRDDPDGAHALAEAALEHWRRRAPGRSLVAPFPDSATQRAEEIEGWLASHP